MLFSSRPLFHHYIYSRISLNMKNVFFPQNYIKAIEKQFIKMKILIVLYTRKVR